jgi:hypothetical protein
MIAPYPVGLAGLVIDIAHGFGDVTSSGHRVGLVVRAIDPDPSALTAHDHGLVLAEASDVCRDDRTSSPFQRCFWTASIHLGKIKESSEMSGNSPKHLRLVNRARDGPTELAFLDPFG